MSENLQRIESLKAEIANLEKAAVSELRAKRKDLQSQIEFLDSEIERITGRTPRTTVAKASGSQKPARAKTVVSVSLDELRNALQGAPDRTINVRKAKYDFASIKALAAANPHLLKLGGKGPWPTVTLIG